VLDATFKGDGIHLNAAVLFADASGFTALTEKLAHAKGSAAAGAESMCQIINNFFTILIDVVEKYGGDIIKFSGDALTIIFPVMPAGGPTEVFADYTTEGTEPAAGASAAQGSAIRKVSSVTKLVAAANLLGGSGNGSGGGGENGEEMTSSGTRTPPVQPGSVEQVLQEITGLYSPSTEVACLRAAQCSLALHAAVHEYVSHLHPATPSPFDLTLTSNR
jgi:hypothetical protein